MFSSTMNLGLVLAVVYGAVVILAIVALILLIRFLIVGTRAANRYLLVTQQPPADWVEPEDPQGS
ncbi:hypothetical protein HQQ81_05550 [Microbacteriaceae bacterium VKM Ac-2854]|nr:hypothetical protein [Microbacteriaceae bacterium VKM Ac-2854]